MASSTTFSGDRANERLPKQTPGWAFFLDVDGTLLELVEHPELARPTPRIKSIVHHLQLVTEGAVALVSGRSISTLDSIFLPLVLPIAGLHGLERRDATGNLRIDLATDKPLDDVRERLANFCEAHPGTLIEDKGVTIALHYRNAPDAKDAAELCMEEVLRELGSHFEIKRGKMVLEVRPSGDNKGSAIGEFMREAPFKGRVPIFIGDDVTDEDGFDMVNRLGGYSIRVGNDGDSNAQYRITNVETVLQWLEEYHHAHW
ncbi:MAG: trehalose-phosphatase [Arenicellales bacterium]|nr:trehalose-phosphatase [Arenicellales bacterium]